MTRQMVERESKMTEMLEKLMAKMDRVSTYDPCCTYKPTYETPICSEQRRCSRFFFLQFRSRPRLVCPLVGHHIHLVGHHIHLVLLR
jgi:hypothetical protein